MWVRSRHMGDQITWTNAKGRALQIDSCAGTFQFSQLNTPASAIMPLTSPVTVISHRPITPPENTWRIFWGTEPSDVVWDFAGFVLLSRSYIVYPPGGGSGFSG